MWTHRVSEQMLSLPGEDKSKLLTTKKLDFCSTADDVKVWWNATRPLRPRSLWKTSDFFNQILHHVRKRPGLTWYTKKKTRVNAALLDQLDSASRPTVSCRINVGVEPVSPAGLRRLLRSFPSSSQNVFWCFIEESTAVPSGVSSASLLHLLLWGLHAAHREGGRPSPVRMKREEEETCLGSELSPPTRIFLAASRKLWKDVSSFKNGCFCTTKRSQKCFCT